MNELLETERAYVEELLCVLEVSGRHPAVGRAGRKDFSYCNSTVKTLATCTFSLYLL